MVRVRVKGHRFYGDPKRVLDRGTPRVRKALELFADELRTAVGKQIYQNLANGLWHQSKNPRFRYYRSWVKYRYGSSRARTRRAGRRRATQTLDQRSYRLPSTLDPQLSGELDRFKFQFLGRALEKHSKVDRDLKWSLTERDATGAAIGSFSIDSAITEIRGVLDEYKRLRDRNRPAAERWLEAQAKEYLDPGSHKARFLFESRTGQGLLRWANRQAMRHQRNELDLHDGLLRSPEKRVRLGQVDQYRKELAGRMQRGGSVPRIAAGRAPYGFQTGALATAWRDGPVTLKLASRGWRIAMNPIEKRDGRNPSAGQLTHYLKRNIAKQSGNPDLLKGTQPRELVRDALQKVRGEWARLGIRLRR